MNSLKKLKNLVKNTIGRTISGFFLILLISICACSPKAPYSSELYQSASLSIECRLDAKQCMLVAYKNKECIDSISFPLKSWPRQNNFWIYADIDTVYVKGLHWHRESPVGQEVFVILSDHKNDLSYYGEDHYIFYKLSSLQGLHFAIPQ